MLDNLERLKSALADRYEIERELGEGGMATVYLARDVRHERNVALKVLHPELAATMGPDRFLQEIRVTANLQHPHILPLFDSGEAGGFLYYVMPYLEGESLRERVAREGELPVAEAVKILREVVDALAAAHQAGVVHRDVKPDNVMISGRHAVVTDFGVAKAVSEAASRENVTTRGVALGTPSYMAPEQAAANEHIDHRVDIYAVGAMGYELLAGRPPFTGKTSQQILAAQVTETPRPVTELRETVPAELGSVLMRCLEKKPADRWQSADELLGQLELYATPTTGVTPTQMVPAVVTTGTPMWMKVAAPAALVAILLAVWLGGREAATDQVVAPTVAASQSGPTFVVVPFENQSGVDSLDAFGAVLADYLTSQISRNDIAPVAPATVVRSLASQNTGTDPVGYFAGATGARYVVTGSYFSQGSGLVVQAEVTTAASGLLEATVGPIEAGAVDFMGAARQVTETLLGVTARIVDPDQPPAGVMGQPRSFAAYRDYLEAVQRGLVEGDLDGGRELVYRALAADSTFAEAYVVAAVYEWNLDDIPAADSLARVAARYRDQMAPYDVLYLEWLQAWLGGERDEVVTVALQIAELDPIDRGLCRDAKLTNQPAIALQACERVLETYDPMSEGLFDFAWNDILQMLHLLGDHESELERAASVRAGYPDRRAAVTREIRALVALGRLDEVEARLGILRERQEEEGWRLGPALRYTAEYLREHGHAEAAGRVIEEAVAWFGDEGVRDIEHGIALQIAGDFDGARGIAEELIVGDAEDDDAVLLAGVSAARLGDREGALEMSNRLAELERMPFALGGPTSRRAAVHAELGELDEAVRLLRQAYELGAGYGDGLRHRQWFANLQGYPAFERWMVPR